jgi:predicted nucleotidyltransferase
MNDNVMSLPGTVNEQQLKIEGPAERLILGVRPMKPSLALDTHRAGIRLIVEANRAVNARVFGSVLRGEDTEDSDLDILVDPEPGMTLLDIGSIRRQLTQLPGVSVDVLTPNALPEKFREAVVAEAVPV